MKVIKRLHSTATSIETFASFPDLTQSSIPNNLKLGKSFCKLLVALSQVSDRISLMVIVNPQRPIYKATVRLSKTNFFYRWY
jgi:hypothetical protein